VENDQQRQVQMGDPMQQQAAEIEKPPQGGEN
jgi:hypothetical protein